MILLCRHLGNLWPHSRSPRRWHRTRPSFPLGAHTSVVLRCLPDSCQHVSVPARFQHRASFLWISSCSAPHTPSWEVTGWQPAVVFWNKPVLKRRSKLLSHYNGQSWKHRWDLFQFLLSGLHTALSLPKTTGSKTIEKISALNTILKYCGYCKCKIETLF